MKLFDVFIFDSLLDFGTLKSFLSTVAAALAIVFNRKHCSAQNYGNIWKKPELLCCKFYQCICCIDLNLKNESHMIASHCCRMVIVVVVGVLHKRRENASDQIAIRSSFESDWFKTWRDTQLKNTLLHAECNSKDCLSIKTRCSNIFAGSGFRG